MSAECADVGSYYTWLQEQADRQPMSLSYLAREWPELERWRARARTKLHELLRCDADAVALDAEILDTWKGVGFVRHTVRYQVAPGRCTEAFLLIPDELRVPAPAVVALHDHGAFYYYGKEKLCAWDGAPGILREFVQDAYGGRYFGDELARRGYVVLCPDAFYFGSQRLDHHQVDRYFTGSYTDLESADQDRLVRAFNDFAHGHEQVLAKYLFASGTTWPGVLFQGDRASLSYLLTRPEVDAERVGCMGLSIGGYRSAHLFALDGRVRAGVVAGWMPSYARQMRQWFRHHTWMVYIPGMLEYLDVPDVVTLGAPQPLMVLNCELDTLYPLDSMQAADEKIAAVYARMQAPERYRCRYYPEPHSLTVPMQEDAFAWLDRWLVESGAGV